MSWLFKFQKVKVTKIDLFCTTHGQFLKIFLYVLRLSRSDPALLPVGGSALGETFCEQLAPWRFGVMWSKVAAPSSTLH